MKLYWSIFLILFLTVSCRGEVAVFGTNPGEGPVKNNGVDPIIIGGDDPDEIIDGEVSALDQDVQSAVPRLSRREFENVISKTFGITGLATARLPADVVEPFDTIQDDSKEMSAIFVAGIESLADELGKQASVNAVWVEETAKCVPTIDDASCFESFAKNLGLSLWRSPLSADEVSGLVDRALAFAEEGAAPNFGIQVIIQSLLLSPKFVYRVEVGTPFKEGLVRLTNYEIVVRLSFLLWGTAPDTALLELAKEEVFSAERIQEIADGMMSDARSDSQIKTFHELWFGYKGVRAPMEFEAPFIAETEALLERVLVTDDLSWKTLFLSEETFVDQTLIDHYEIEGAQPGWVSYQNEKRAGILSHGSMMSLSARDTNENSVTLRGKLIATRLLCTEIADPPKDADIDNPPEITEDECKSDVYIKIRDSSPRCFGCHQTLDPIGFGLEQFDGLGKYREFEYENTDCSIPGDGVLVGLGEFNGPKEMSNLMLSSDALTSCAVQQFLTFSRGSFSASTDKKLKDRIHENFGTDQDFKAMVKSYINDPTFRYRREEK